MKYQALSIPDWFRKNVIYQINPRTFSKEGTLNSITNELPFLNSLGLKTIYLCPVFEEDDSLEQSHWSKRQKKSQTGNPKNQYRISNYFMSSCAVCTYKDSIGDMFHCVFASERYRRSNFYDCWCRRCTSTRQKNL